MSNSSLANYINRSLGNYTNRIPDADGLCLITKITIHCAYKKGDCYDLAELLLQAPDASYHYGIATDGTIALYVDETYATFSTGNEDNDNVAVNIIVMNDKETSPSISSATYDALIKLCTDICRRNYILECKWLPNDREHSTLTAHRWFSNKSCPGDIIYSKFGSIAKAVNDNLKHATYATSESEAALARSTIAHRQINPYMAVVDTNATAINYNQLRNAGVIGAMFLAGNYYDANHQKSAKFTNPWLKQQIKEVTDANMPFALYTIVRARTVKEAKLECDQLFYVIAKYPPKLGIWLNLQMKGVNKLQAQAILDKYYEYIVRWGLKGKCGLYCTQTMANLVNWPAYTDKFSYWKIDMLSNVSKLDELLTPTLFK